VHAQDIAKKEGAKLSPAGAELIALMGDGSFRDTLGILQKVLTVSRDKTLSEDEIAAVVGAPSGKLVNDFLGALSEKKIGDALQLVSQALVGGTDVKMFTLLAIAKIRGVLLLRFAPEMEKEVASQFAEDDLSFLKKLSGKEGAALNAALLSELIGALLEMSRAPLPQIPLELAILRVFGQDR